MRAETLLSHPEVAKRGWHVTTQAADPAKILVHEPQRQIQPVLGTQLRSLIQIGLGGGELLSVPVEDAPVVHDPLHPQMIAGAPQYR